MRKSVALAISGKIHQVVAAHDPDVEPVSPVRVLIADDEPLFVDSVAALLNNDERVKVIGTASNGQDAVDLASALEPDVTLMDISMPMLDGIEAARRIRLALPNATILILTGSSIAADVDRARQAGVAGFLTKDRIGTQLVSAILEVADR
jgi:two-component system, NarL family, nitrate/nitrite response regulator NarL